MRLAKQLIIFVIVATALFIVTPFLNLYFYYSLLQEGFGEQIYSSSYFFMLSLALALIVMLIFRHVGVGALSVGFVILICAISVNSLNFLLRNIADVRLSLIDDISSATCFRPDGYPLCGYTEIESGRSFYGVSSNLRLELGSSIYDAQGRSITLLTPSDLQEPRTSTSRIFRIDEATCGDFVLQTLCYFRYIEEENIYILRRSNTGDQIPNFLPVGLIEAEQIRRWIIENPRLFAKSRNY